MVLVGWLLDPWSPPLVFSTSFTSLTFENIVKASKIAEKSKHKNRVPSSPATPSNSHKNSENEKSSSRSHSPLINPSPTSPRSDFPASRFPTIPLHQRQGSQ
ncbi:hypothetical protein HYDPIDRAFT_108745 [Hydnomerulius pinastri MD-312]|nr:hypothetical protein HYDPIDRAFT_108745 [Hydnomerulius pinastri MD-312]